MKEFVLMGSEKADELEEWLLKALQNKEIRSSKRLAIVSFDGETDLSCGAAFFNMDHESLRTAARCLATKSAEDFVDNVILKETADRHSRGIIDLLASLAKEASEDDDDDEED